MYSDCTVNCRAGLRILSHASQYARPLVRAFAFAAIAAALLFAASRARADGSESIHWSSIAQAQVKVDQTTPLTWGVYQAAGKKDKPDKKLSNLVLVLIGHRYLLIDLKAKQVYEVPLKQLHQQGDEIASGDLLGAAREIPTSDWVWRNVGPAELYRIKMGDYGRLLQITLPHPYLISPYY